MSLKNPVTQPGIDPGTVAQRLNHYATPGPIILEYVKLYRDEFKNYASRCFGL